MTGTTPKSFPAGMSSKKLSRKSDMFTSLPSFVFPKKSCTNELNYSSLAIGSAAASAPPMLGTRPSSEFADGA